MNSPALSAATLDERLATLPPHPRLFMTEPEFAEVRERTLENPLLAELDNYILQAAGEMADAAPVERVMEGRRLLGASRIVLRRLSYLSYAWRVTREERFCDAAIREMRNVAEWEDWNPSHFLDVGELCLAVALGYDWLYHDLNEEERQIIRTALVEKALKPKLEQPIHTDNNWNPVCNGACAIGALAVADDEPELARQILEDSIKLIPTALKMQLPDGVYPEGPSYWGYGTNYTVFYLDAMRSALGDMFLDDELLQVILASGTYIIHATDPADVYHNFYDSVQEATAEPALNWIARQTGNASLLWAHQSLIEKVLIRQRDANSAKNRHLPFHLIWNPAINPRRFAPPQEIWFHGKGVNPVVTFRTEWGNPDALYFGFKGGTGGESHGHLDVGSFVLTADGVRWGVDMDRPDYGPLEAKGVNLWDRRPGGKRWGYWPYNNFSHNTLTINGALHDVKARADFDPVEPPSSDQFTASLDMSAVFADEAASVHRAMRYVAGAGVVVQDNITALDNKPAEVQWQMLTGAELELPQATPRVAILRQDGKTLTLHLREPAEARFIEIPTDPDFTTNRMVGLKTIVPAGEQGRITVQLVPGEPGDTPEMLLEDF